MVQIAGVQGVDFLPQSVSIPSYIGMVKFGIMLALGASVVGSNPATYTTP